jgi:hypothetical protein
MIGNTVELKNGVNPLDRPAAFCCLLRLSCSAASQREQKDQNSIDSVVIFHRSNVQQ